ncbi:MAG: acyl-CoA dehydrogenase [Deltaproteobacteria bacterium]|jgi:alkylation response protein AidB-like acyl-CoA dehydrogenase|nr:acyl-CoA dehydrogenase [Deltaproteobacteria bacterium]
MDFGLSEEQALLQDTVGQFLANENDPNQLRARFDSEERHDAPFWNGMIELGLGGLMVPEEFGGAGLELLDAALVAETLGRGAAPGPFLGHTLAALAIASGGSDAQKKAWLPKLATGDALGTVALGEDGGRWLPDQWELKANGSVSGLKHYVPNASVADLIVVGSAGGGLALVERASAGVETEAYAGADRTRHLDSVRFDGAACEALPGEGAASRLCDAGLVLLAADAFGGASRCVEMSVDYAHNREQFGVTIGHFQALKHQLANMALEVEPARGLLWYAAHVFDKAPEESERMAAVAKAHLTDRFMAVARDAVEAHGGIGYTWECDVQIWFKRAMFDRSFLGSPSMHRDRAARHW